MFDFTILTLGEVAFIEDLSGRSISSINDEAPQGKFLAALACVVKRRQGATGPNGNGAFTFNQAMDLSLTEAQELLGLNEGEPDEDSDEGKDDSSAASATRSKRPSSSTSD